MTALRRAARSATRSRCQETGGGGAIFQTAVSAAQAQAARVREQRTLENCIDPPLGIFHYRRGRVSPWHNRAAWSNSSATCAGRATLQPSSPPNRRAAEI